MFNLQGSEIIFILLIALVILGPEKLPDAVRRFGQTYNELKKMGTGFQSELKSALDEPMREMRETADMVRDAADPAKIAASAEATDAATSPAPGDPPLVDPPVAEQVTDEPVTDEQVTDEQVTGEPATDAAPVNRIAAANSSGAIAAANTAPPDDGPVDTTSPDDGPDDVTSPVDGAANGDGQDPEAAVAATGPSFHSAGPRRIAPRADEPADDDTSAPDDNAVASPDEAATA